MNDSTDESDIGSNDWASSSTDWSDSGDEFEVEIAEEFDDPEKKARYLRRMVEARSRQSDESKVYCTECGQQNERHYKFCLGCGTPVIVNDQKKSPVQQVQMTSTPSSRSSSPQDQNAAQQSRAIIVVSMALTMFIIVVGMAMAIYFAAV